MASKPSSPPIENPTETDAPSPRKTNVNVASVEEAIADIREGKMVILVDDEDRENEGDLCMAADLVTPDAINFMATHGRGLICLSLEEEQLKKLRLSMMVPDHENTAQYGTAFTISIEAREGVTTGISAHDRARTIQVANSPNAKPADIVRPGHIFPLRARDGGVLVRGGQTEGMIDLARLAGSRTAGVSWRHAMLHSQRGMSWQSDSIRSSDMRTIPSPSCVRLTLSTWHPQMPPTPDCPPLASIAISL